MQPAEIVPKYAATRGRQYGASTATVHFHNKFRVFHGLPYSFRDDKDDKQKGGVKNRLPVFLV